uniref:NB-ARC domain-containing protein n=1 Tax=Physcomitrium patens TaxID=3218 RepID=A0A7I4BYZ1_PHYPA
MTCSKILSGEDPFDGIDTKKELLKKIEKGGIGKTTLAKITFDTMQHMYNVSYFVESIQKKDSGLSIICKVLNKLNFESKPKSLEEAQAMMKEVLMNKKFMLVLDDVKDKSQINDEVVKSYPTKIHKFDIEELDKDASLKLFIAYSCRDGDELPKELIEVGEEIVRSCNGLPLSLKVLGSFLGGQKRLRCWKRALQKLRRGRPLDGDEIDSEYKL